MRPSPGWDHPALVRALRLAAWSGPNGRCNSGTDYALRPWHAARAQLSFILHCLHRTQPSINSDEN